jgi:hypothetical protein
MRTTVPTNAVRACVEDVCLKPIVRAQHISSTVSNSTNYLSRNIRHARLPIRNHATTLSNDEHCGTAVPDCILSQSEVSVFVQLSSSGRTGILSMVISLKFAQGPGGPVCFLRAWQPFVPSAGTQDFFLSAWTCALVGGGKKTRKGKARERTIK